MVLIDAPAVLGWERGARSACAMAWASSPRLLRCADDVQRMPEQPLEPLAHVLIASWTPPRSAIAQAEAPEVARTEMGAVVAAMIDGLAGPARADSPAGG